MQDVEQEWAALMRAANAGDGRAYARLLRLVTPVLRGIVRARGRSFGPEQHEDIVQEVLLAIHLKRHTWQSDSPLRPWLFAITRYKVVDAFRARGVAVHLPVEDFSEVLEAAADVDLTVQGDLDRLIGQLDGRSAEIVRGVHLKGEAAAETGARLSMSEGAVRVALHRAMQRLASLGKGGRE